MSKPFRIIMDFNAPIRPKSGQVMVVDISVRGLEKGLNKHEEMVTALAYTLAAHMKGMTNVPLEDARSAFLRFMDMIWQDAPVPLPPETMVSGMGDA